MAVRRGTTPTLSITAEGLDLTECTVYVTLAQRDNRITKSNKGNNGEMVITHDGDNSEIQVFYSQSDTLHLEPGAVDVQLRWVEPDDSAHASNIKTFTVNKTLLEGVLKYER